MPGRPGSAQRTVELVGPFFELDHGEVIARNVEAMMAAIAEEGERLARERTPVRSGRTRGGITGRVRSLGGRKWHRTAVISQQYVFPWPNKGAGFRAQAQYRGGKLERQRHMFRDTTRILRRSVAVARADLTKGLN